MTADVSVDRETIEHLDFEVTCHARYVLFLLTPLGAVVVTKGPVCEEPAVARAVCNICQYGLLVCVSHRSQIASDPSALCGQCKSRAQGAVLYKFVPLPGGVS